MVCLLLASSTSFLFLIRHVTALQVTPNSPCAAACLDHKDQDVTDPNASNTLGSEIVCRDPNFSNTSVGKKFESCITCLQASTFSEAGEDDQGSFIYNIRYAFDSCVFGLENTTDPISTSCSTPSSCGPIQTALENGITDQPGNTYGYCSADDHSFLNSFPSECLSCLRVATETHYLSNFLVALQAGCLQQPDVGTLIGIQGSVFSRDSVNITFPGYNQTSTGHHKKGLPHKDIIGISVGLAVLAGIIIAALYIWYRKRRNRNRISQFTSPLDSRFGAKNITAPTDSSYSNAYIPPPIRAFKPFKASDLSIKERQALGLDQPATTRHSSIIASQTSSASRLQRDNQLPPYSSPEVPTHHASVSEARSESPVTSIDSGNTIELSTYSSRRPSSTNKVRSRPPPISISSPPRRYVPVETGLSENQSQISKENAALPPYPSRADSQRLPRSVPQSRNARRTSVSGIGSVNASSITSTRLPGVSVVGDARLDFEFSEREKRERELEEMRARRKKGEQKSRIIDREEPSPGLF